MVSVCMTALLSTGFIGNVSAQSQSPQSPQREEMASAAKSNFPEAYAFEKKLLEIRKQMQSIIEQYKEERITLDKTKELLKPLLTQQLEIMNSIDYQVERSLMGFLSTPEHR